MATYLSVDEKKDEDDNLEGKSKVELAEQDELKELKKEAEKVNSTTSNALVQKTAAISPQPSKVAAAKPKAVEAVKTTAPIKPKESNLMQEESTIATENDDLFDDEDTL